GPAARRAGGMAARRLAGAEDQPGQDPCRGPQARRSAPGLSGIPVPLRPRPLWAAEALPELGAVGKSRGPGAGGAARADERSGVLQARAGAERGAEPTPEGLGELLRAGLRAAGVAVGQRLGTQSV